MNTKIADAVAGVLFLGAVAIASFVLLQKDTYPAEVSPEKKKIIVVDAGHGGDDPGKVGCGNVLEKDINLEISLILKEKLKAAGYDVVLTREGDAALCDEDAPNKKASDMRKRCEIIEKSGACMVISIHQNSFSDSEVSGAQTFYYTHSTEGKKLALELQKAIKSGLDESNERKEKPNDSYYMLLHTPCPTVIVECGFLSNPEETGQLTDAAYQDKLCEAILDGVESYLNKNEAAETSVNQRQGFSVR